MSTRKYLFFICIMIAALVTGCSADRKNSADSKNDITMFVATDIHYFSKDLYDNGVAFQTYLDTSDGKLLKYSDEIVSSFSNDISKEKPEVLIISGDLTNNGEKESHVQLAEKLKEIEEMGTSVFVIPGNHDILNPWAREIKGEEQIVTERIDANDFESIYKKFGYEEAISRDKATLSYLAAPADNLYLLMLDTCIYEFNDLIGMPTTNGEIAPETFEWIKQCSKLAQDNNAQVVTVMHHNLLNHSDVLYSGFTLDNNEEALAVLQECGLNLVLSGHLHIQDIKSSFEEQNQVFDIATSSLSVYPVQYGVLKFAPSEGFDYSTSRVDVEGWAKESGNRDANIINFKEYSKEYFANISSKKTYDNLTAGGSYTKDEIEQMTETMGLLNINYFGGTISKVKKEVMESRGYQLLTDTAETEFLKAYILSMLSDDEIDDNKLHIPLQEGK